MQDTTGILPIQTKFCFTNAATKYMCVKERECKEEQNMYYLETELANKTQTPNTIEV